MNFESIEESAAPRNFPWEKCPDEGTREHHTFLHRNVDALLRENAVLKYILQEVALVPLNGERIVVLSQMAREAMQHIELQKINEAKALREEAEREP